MSLSIDQLIGNAFDPVAHEIYKHTKWTDPLMQDLEKAGHIHYLYLADLLDQTGFNGVSELKRITIPMVWTTNDELKNPSATQKVSLVKNLLENLVESHDSLFSHKYGKEITKLIIAKDYFRVLGETQHITEQQAMVRKLHTLYAEVAPM